VEAEPEACGRGFGAVAGGEAKAAEGGESGSGAGWRLGRVNNPTGPVKPSLSGSSLSNQFN